MQLWIPATGDFLKSSSFSSPLKDFARSATAGASRCWVHPVMLRWLSEIWACLKMWQQQQHTWNAFSLRRAHLAAILHRVPWQQHISTSEHSLGIQGANHTGEGIRSSTRTHSSHLRYQEVHHLCLKTKGRMQIYQPHGNSFGNEYCMGLTPTAEPKPRGNPDPSARRANEQLALAALLPCTKHTGGSLRPCILSHSTQRLPTVHPGELKGIFPHQPQTYPALRANYWKIYSD